MPRRFSAPIPPESPIFSPIILKNLRGEISALKDAEDEALKLYIANQHAKEALNA